MWKEILKEKLEWHSHDGNRGWNYETRHLHCLSHWVSGTLSQRPWETSTLGSQLALCAMGYLE